MRYQVIVVSQFALVSGTLCAEGRIVEDTDRLPNALAVKAQAPDKLKIVDTQDPTGPEPTVAQGSAAAASLSPPTTPESAVPGASRGLPEVAAGDPPPTPVPSDGPRSIAVTADDPLPPASVGEPRILEWAVRHGVTAEEFRHAGRNMVARYNWLRGLIVE